MYYAVTVDGGFIRPSDEEITTLDEAVALAMQYRASYRDSIVALLF